ncbi:MAG: hypothetical protein ACK5XN_38845 [Bacteroidota bacterium]
MKLNPIVYTTPPEFSVETRIADLQKHINELYDFRMAYHALLVNEWAKQGLYDVHKSYYHHDGQLPFDDENYFIVVAMLPTGQISNHYHKDYWGLFRCDEAHFARYSWDGHTSKDVITRLIDLNLQHFTLRKIEE